MPITKTAILALVIFLLVGYLIGRFIEFLVKTGIKLFRKKPNLNYYNYQGGNYERSR